MAIAPAPHSGIGEFCKHMVAVVLAANALGPDAEMEGAGVLSRIRDHLKQKSVDALVGMIMELAERDPALLRRLDVAAAVVHADDGTLRMRLRKAIDAATRTPDYLEYGEVQDWASNVEASLDAIGDLAPGPRAGLALELAEYAIDRIERAVDSIDDSEGGCSELLHHARDIHLAAAESRGPTPCNSPATSLPAKWMATTVRSEMPRNFTPTCLENRASPNIAALPRRLGRNCPSAAGEGGGRRDSPPTTSG